MTQRFKASVQYGDWEGTAAADDLDKDDLRDYLRQQNLISEKEFLIAVKLRIGENHPGRVMQPSVTAIVYDSVDYDTVAGKLQREPDPLSVREVQLELSLEEFIGMFKRFSVTLSSRGLDLIEREYTT